jgi:hypothetical protein
LGYRVLSDDEQEKVRKIRMVGAAMQALLDDIDGDGMDKRWLAIARTHFQEGLMAAVRSVAKPEFF